MLCVHSLSYVQPWLAHIYPADLKLQGAGTERPCVGSAKIIEPWFTILKGCKFSCMPCCISYAGRALQVKEQILVHPKCHLWEVGNRFGEHWGTSLSWTRSHWFSQVLWLPLPCTYENAASFSLSCHPCTNTINTNIGVSVTSATKDKCVSKWAIANIIYNCYIYIYFILFSPVL